MASGRSRLIHHRTHRFHKFSQRARDDDRALPFFRNVLAVALFPQELQAISPLPAQQRVDIDEYRIAWLARWFLRALTATAGPDHRQDREPHYGFVHGTDLLHIETAIGKPLAVDCEQTVQYPSTQPPETGAGDGVASASSWPCKNGNSRGSNSFPPRPRINRDGCPWCTSRNSAKSPEPNEQLPAALGAADRPCWRESGLTLR